MNKSILHIFVVLAFLIAGISCNSSSNNSLSIEQYCSIGIPSPDSLWNALDYEKCANSLTELKKRDFNSLPNLGNKESEVLFMRIVNSENFESIINIDTNAVDSGTKGFQSLGQSLNRLLFIYMDQSKPEQKYHQELAELLVSMLKFSEVLFNSVAESADIDSTSVSYQSGYKKVEMGYSNMLSGLLKMQADTTSFKKKDLEKLSNEIVNSVSNYWKLVSAERKEELFQRIESLSENGATELIRSNYANIKNKFANRVARRDEL